MGSKHSEIMRARWANPDSAFNSQEYRDKKSKIQKELWEDPNSIFNAQGYREKHSKIQKELWANPEYQEKHSNRMRERWQDPEYREKKAKIQRDLWDDPNSGYNSQKYRERMSGKNHPNWRGGIMRKPYPFEFNDELKRRIRDRDGNMCISCGSTRRLAVHHINRVKEDLRPENLITLCPTCHGKTHN